MFDKLHRQLTIFCTATIGTILVVLSLLCLFYARQSIIQTDRSSFQKQLNTILTSLQSQEYISHQWLNQMQNEYRFSIYLYDNGEPLYYEQLHEDASNKRQASLREKAIRKSQVDIFYDNSGESAYQEEFSLRESSHSYYTSVGYLTQNTDRLSFVIFYDLSHLQHNLYSLYVLILAADVITLIILSVFSWHFTRRVLLPVETSRQKQQEFIAAASHELRSPLTVILSGMETLDKTQSPEQRHHFCCLMQEEGRRMQHLISDMLLLANADAHGMKLHLQETSLDELLLDSFEKYESIALSRKLSLRISLPEEDIPFCRTDPERIHQLLSILLDNAVSYTPENGTILLFLMPARSHRITFGVANTGPSIPDGEKERIFDRFYRAEKSHTDHEHFGLGLCMAKEIIRAHHGSIRVTEPEVLASDVAELQKFPVETGTLFLMELPL